MKISKLSSRVDHPAWYVLFDDLLKNDVLDRDVFKISSIYLLKGEILEESF